MYLYTIENCHEDNTLEYLCSLKPENENKNELWKVITNCENIDINIYELYTSDWFYCKIRSINSKNIISASIKSIHGDIMVDIYGDLSINMNNLKYEKNDDGYKVKGYVEYKGDCDVYRNEELYCSFTNEKIEINDFLFSHNIYTITCDKDLINYIENTTKQYFSCGYLCTQTSICYSQSNINDEPKTVINYWVIAIIVVSVIILILVISIGIVIYRINSKKRSSSVNNSNEGRISRSESKKEIKNSTETIDKPNI